MKFVKFKSISVSHTHPTFLTPCSYATVDTWRQSRPPGSSILVSASAQLGGGSSTVLTALGSAASSSAEKGWDSGEKEACVWVLSPSEPCVGALETGTMNWHNSGFLITFFSICHCPDAESSQEFQGEEQ